MRYILHLPFFESKVFTTGSLHRTHGITDSHLKIITYRYQVSSIVSFTLPETIQSLFYLKNRANCPFLHFQSVSALTASRGARIRSQKKQIHFCPVISSRLRRKESYNSKHKNLLLEDCHFTASDSDISDETAI